MDRLAEARRAITGGTPFGQVTAGLLPEELEQLKSWFVAEPAVPNLAARLRAVAVPTAAVPTAAVPSGNLCRCGGLMVRTGTCETCAWCGTSSGGCG